MLTLFLNSLFIIIFLTYLCRQKMFFYKNFIITSALRSKIALIFIYFIKLFRTIIRFTLASVFAINI